MFRNIANQNPEYVNVGLCGSYLHQTTSNAPNAINQKCLIISALAVGIIILRSLLPLENKVYHAKTKNSFKKSSLFLYAEGGRITYEVYNRVRQQSTGLFLEKCPEIAYNCDQVTNEIFDIRYLLFEHRASNLDIVFNSRRI